MDSRRPAIGRIVICAAVSLLVVGTVALTGNIPSSSEARDFADDRGPLAPVLFVPLFILANSRDRVGHPRRRCRPCVGSTSTGTGRPKAPGSRSTRPAKLMAEAFHQSGGTPGVNPFPEKR